MKNKLIVICFSLFPFYYGQAQEKAVPVISKIREVTVFTNGAQVSRLGTVTLKTGYQQFVFENLPQAINAQSIQVSGTGDFTILSVNNQLNYLKPQQKSKEILVLEDSLELLQNKQKINSASLEVLKDEESLLKANQALGGSQTGVKVDELKSALDLYRTRLTEIKTKTIKLLNDNKILSELIRNVNNQLTQLRNKRNTPTSEVLVTVTAGSASKAQLALSYLVSEAGWIAAYDVRATEISKPIALTYKAKVTQSSGEAWDNVKLTLSTGDPEMSGIVPLLSPWYIAIIEARSMSRAKSRNEKVMFVAPVVVDSVKEEVEISAMEDKVSAPSASSYTQMRMNQTSTEFVIELPYTIPTDGQQYTVEVKSATLPATYEYYCVPKIDTGVFLLAKITGWEDLNLVSGETSLFFEGTYVGTAYMDTQNTKDTMKVSLGRDKSIVVTRTRMKDFTSRKMIGSTRTDTRSFEIVARNKKKEAVTLMIDDQIPVSTTKEVEVESTDNSGGIFDKTDGKITWKMQLPPSGSKTFTNGYKVSYPKDKSVVLE